MKHNCYNTRKNIPGSIALFAAFVLTQGAQAATELDLEPCINGGVSATGLYVSQRAENEMMEHLVDAEEPASQADDSDC
ncbi:MAG: hypothetical protein WBO73_06390 [Gammaproteobacteria bacterium]|jgi:hypothetical protein